MEHRVVITGLGVISPVGNNINDFWNNLVDGYCGIDFIKGFEEYELPISVAGQVKDFNPDENGLDKNDTRRTDPYCQYALAAAYQAMQDSGLVSGENVAPERLGVYIGSGRCRWNRPGFSGRLRCRPAAAAPIRRWQNTPP